MRNNSFTNEDALKKMMNICSAREMCSSDILTKLQSWGIAVNDQKKILRKLSDENFFNDERYARAFIHDKLKLQKWGRIKIRYALKIKQIPEKISEHILQENDDWNYTSELENLIRKKMKSVKTEEPGLATKARLFRFAAGRGFESELIYSILNKLIND